MKNKKSEDEILGEFLETFELHHSLKVIKAKNYSKINKKKNIKINYNLLIKIFVK